jgi:tRNA-specific 2-thiouridylase
LTIKHKAIALLLGGLDSLLAVRVMQEQGIEVEGINFYTGFCVEGHTHAIRNHGIHKDKHKRNNALWGGRIFSYISLMLLKNKKMFC